MFTHQKGFTLIELLVVVLIIGILAAVALPQYQKAVGKARMAEVKSVIPTYLNAIHVAYMETGNSIPSDDMLSIDLPSSKNWDYEIDECIAANGVHGCGINVYGKGPVEGVLIQFHEKEYFESQGNDTPSYWSCFGDNETQIALCKTLGFTKYDEEHIEYVEP